VPYGGSLHQSAGALGIRPWIPFDSVSITARTSAGSTHAVRRFSNHFSVPVTADVHGRTVVFPEKEDSAADRFWWRFEALSLGCQLRFGVYKKLPSRSSTTLGYLALAPGANIHAKEPGR